MANKPVHAPMTQFQRRDNQLLVGGKTLAQIEAMVLNTPFYAYDKSVIEKQVSALKNALPSAIQLHYAIKANPMPALVHFMTNQVTGFDVASRKEMIVALQSGMAPEHISFAGPGKADDDLRAAIVAGITLHSESPSEIERTIALGEEMAIVPNITIRVNPAFELKASGMKMAGGAKPFGIDEELLPELLAQLDYKKVNLRGFHIFAGSQNLKPEAIIEAHQQTFALAAELIALAGKQLDYINIGGGIGIPYFPGEQRVPLDVIGANLSELMTHYQTVIGETHIVMELGRYFVGECGVYVSKIVDIKNSRGTKYLVCDGGLHHHLSNSGNFGQVIRKNYPAAIGNRLEAEDTEQVNIVGPLCTPLDILADKLNLPKASTGDYVVIYQSGAYGATASPQDFLSQPQLTEILL